MMRLTYERQSRGWSKNRLAQEAGITPSDISKIENGRLVPYPKQLEKIAKAIQIPLEDSHLLLADIQYEKRCS